MHAVWINAPQWCAWKRKKEKKRWSSTGFCRRANFIYLSLNDLPLHITNTKVVCQLFADDNSIHTCGCRINQIFSSRRLNDVAKWCHENSMIIYPRKTKNVLLASRYIHQCKPLMLTLGTSITEQVREHGVLGVTLDEELKWQSHIDGVNKQLEIYFCLASLSTM